MTTRNTAAGNPERPVDAASAWDALAASAPALHTLERDVQRAARSLRPGSTVTIDQLWAGRGGFKGRLSALVGWGAADPCLRSSTAYETAYMHLYGVLEDFEEIASGGRR